MHDFAFSATKNYALLKWDLKSEKTIFPWSAGFGRTGRHPGPAVGAERRLFCQQSCCRTAELAINYVWCNGALGYSTAYLHPGQIAARHECEQKQRTRIGNRLALITTRKETNSIRGKEKLDYKAHTPNKTNNGRSWNINETNSTVANLKRNNGDKLPQEVTTVANVNVSTTGWWRNTQH